MKYQSVLAATLLSASTLAMSTAAFAQTSGSEPEEIVVTGYRQSLIDAANLKQRDARIVDAIVAEDIGKLPDNNIAEALQRVTGVSINTDFGIGDSVSIRGLPQNRVELNGRSTAGDSRGGVSLQDFPSSFLKSVEVIKSPTADMIEGALGGTVQLNTVRPLDLKKTTVAGSLDFEYADKTEHLAPIANVTAGNVWDIGNGGRFGVIGSINYQDRELREDFFHTRTRLYSEAAVAGQTGNAPNGQFVVGDQNTVEQDVEQRERTAMNLTFQFEPASGLGNVYLDLNTTDRSGSQQGSSILDVGGSRAYDANTIQDGNGKVKNYTLPNVFVIPKAFSQFRNTESFSHAIGGEWDFTDKLNVSAEYSIAESESFEPDSEFNLRPINKTRFKAWQAAYDVNDATTTSGDARQFQNLIDATITQNGDELPGLTYSDGNALLSPENLAVRAYSFDDRRIDTTEDAFRFDVDYSDGFGLDFISGLKAGVRFTDSSNELNHSRFRTGDIDRRVTTGTGTDDEKPYTVFIDEFEALFPGTFQTVNHNNSFTQTGLTGRNDLLNYRIYDAGLLSDSRTVFSQIQTLLEGTSNAVTGSYEDNLDVQEGSYRDIQEETRAIYLSADLDFDRLTGVVGLRYVETDLDSTVLDGAGARSTKNNSYDDLLPSLNLSYDLMDDTKVRFAAAKVMRRADYGNLSSATNIDGNVVFATQGSFDLEPFRATQYDLSVEKYFGKGGLLSGAIFHKDVESFFATDLSCVANPLTTTTQNVTEFENVCLLNTAGVDNPLIQNSTVEADVIAARNAGLTGIRTEKQVNGESGTVKGFEIGYQQQFDFLPGFWSGFGVNANYTYSDSEQPNGNPLLDISENSYNLQAYYENAKFQARLAYNYRDEFLDNENEKRIETIGVLGLNSTDTEADPTAGNNYRDERGQLDAAASWVLNDHFTVVANASNILGEPSSFSTALGSTYRYTEADRRFSFGVRAKY